MNAIVYIDGYNMYYGCLKNSQHKWLDLEKMCDLLLPTHQVTQIKYFTARIKAHPQ
jgi:hypothetical protein